MDDIIRDFLRYSIRSDFSEFDWSEAFGTYEYFLKEKLASHGQLDFDEFVECFDNMYGTDSAECDIDGLYWATLNSNWVSVTSHDVLMGILKVQYEACRESFANCVHGLELKPLYDRLQQWHSIGEPERIQLFDECIHAQHETGMILEDVDIDDIKAEVDEEWKEEQESKPVYVTNMRDFL